MSSKFSRRSTRVQRKPHVCISKPQPGSEPTPPGPTGTISAGWDFMDLFTFAQSTANLTFGGEQIDENTWRYTGNDNQGNAFELLVTAQPGANTHGQLTMSGLPAPGNVVSGDGSTWDGSLPFHDAAVVFTDTGSLSGGGTYDIDLQ